MTQYLGLNLEKYKYMVYIFLGEQRGQGLKWVWVLFIEEQFKWNWSKDSKKNEVFDFIEQNDEQMLLG